MADKSFVRVNIDTQEGHEVKLVDLGDDTYAEAVAIIPGRVAPNNAAPSTATPATSSGELEVEVGDEIFLQNTGDAPIYVKYATGASSSSFHFILAPGTALKDGKGAALSKVMAFATTISWAFGSGSNPNIIAWKQ